MGGAEKVVVTQERIAFNEPFTRLYKPDEEQVASISISSRALSGVKVRVFSLWLHNLDGTKLPKKRAHFRGLINASISGVNGPVPLFLLFRALGVVNDEDIVRYIYPDGNVPADVEEIITLNAKAAGG